MAAAVLAVEALTTPVFRTPNMDSPATRRRRPLALVSSNTPSVDLTLNDDAAEKRQRRLSRVTSVALSSPSTPRSANRGLDSERNLTKSGLTNFQLKDLYSNCIKLSTENKINSKNAFGLHLIDYMQDLIKTVKEGEMTNFQVASCTLDASAKIYAGRVDSIHAQAYKMLGGLGRAENAKDGDGEGENATDEPQAGKQKSKKVNHRPGNTIETNLKNLDVNQFDLEFEVDPLFHKTSAAFDEGGTDGLLVNHLFVCDDSCELLLDSTVTMATKSVTTEGQTSQDNTMIDLSELRDAYSSINFESYQICPYFSEFEFTNWNKEDNVNPEFSNMIQKSNNDEHAFDIDAPVTEHPDDYPEAMGEDDGDEDIGDMGEDVEYGHDACERRNGLSASATLAFADGEEARLINAQDARYPSDMAGSAAATLGSLCLELSDKPSEYSYFKSGMLPTWAGPEHWKMKARLSKLAGITSATQDQSKKKRAKKEPFKVDFDAELDVKQYFSTSRAATTLAKSTLEKFSSDKTTFPDDLHYDADSLFRLFTKPKILVRRQLRPQTEVADDSAEWYNYNNPNDAANYCPDLQDGGDDDDDNVTCGTNTSGSQDMTNAGVGTDMTYDLSHSSQGLSFSNESATDMTMFAGDGLVAQPNKVAKIDIGYAKTAKKMDVKKLKAAMWGLLTKEQNENKENVPNETEGVTEKPGLEENTWSEPKSFKNIYSHLPDKISKNMAKNLSVPIAFVCILHLANEKCLKMIPDLGMADFAIGKEKS